MVEWRTRITKAAELFASRSGGPKFGLEASLTDALLVRTGGKCSATLPPLPDQVGFMRGVLLLSGPSQELHWWRPHPAAFARRDAHPNAEFVVRKAIAGNLWLHHSSTRFHSIPKLDANGTSKKGTNESTPVDRGISVWLLFNVWYTQPMDSAVPVREARANLHANPPAKRATKSAQAVGLHPRHESGELQNAASMLQGAAKRLKLGAPINGASMHGDAKAADDRRDASYAWAADCVPPAAASNVPFETRRRSALGGADDAAIETEQRVVHEALQSVARVAIAHSTELSASMPSLAVRRIVHWALPPRGALPPQPGAQVRRAGTLRTLGWRRERRRRRRQR